MVDAKTTQLSTDGWTPYVTAGVGCVADSVWLGGGCSTSPLEVVRRHRPTAGNALFNVAPCCYRFDATTSTTVAVAVPAR
jgi:hypothetical protein